MSARSETVTALCRLLSHGDEADRCYASRALGRLRDEAALPYLIEHLHDEDPDVCIDAAEALGSIGDPEAVPSLFEVLQHHPDGEARTAAVEALAKIPDPRVPGALLEIAAERPENLAWDDEWDDWWDMQLHAIDALGRLQIAEAVPVLERLLEDEENQGIETELLTALARIGAEGLAAIERRLKHGTTAERRRAAIILGHAASEEAICLLGQTLLDPEAEVRVAGIRSLGAANACDYLRVILVSLKDPSPEVRNAAVETCTRLATGTCRTEEFANQLHPLLEDESALVRATTIDTLATLAVAHPPSLEQREQISLRLSDRDPRVAAAACRFLAKHPFPQAKSDLLRIASRRKDGIYLRQQAIRALGTMNDPDDEVIDTLVRNVNDPEQPVRMEALNALMKLATSEKAGAFTALDTVISALRGSLEAEDDPTSIGDAAAPTEPSVVVPADAVPKGKDNAAGSCGHQATSTLEAISLDTRKMLSEPEQTETALSAAGDASPVESDGAVQQELAELQEFLELAEESAAVAARREFDVHTDVRLLAARVLASSERPEAIAALVEAMRCDEPELRREAALSLGHIASRAPGLPELQTVPEPLLTQIELGTSEVRHACIRVLARLGMPESLPHLLGALEDEAPLVRIEAVNGLVDLSTALAEAGDRETLPLTEVTSQIQKRLADTANGVRLAAAKGLVTLLQRVESSRQLRQEVMQGIVTAAFIDQGTQAREMGRILKKMGDNCVTSLLLPRLGSLQGSAERRIVIEMLEEVLDPETNRGPLADPGDEAASSRG